MPSPVVLISLYMVSVFLLKISSIDSSRRRVWFAVSGGALHTPEAAFRVPGDGNPSPEKLKRVMRRHFLSADKP